MYIDWYFCFVFLDIMVSPLIHSLTIPSRQARVRCPTVKFFSDKPFMLALTNGSALVPKNRGFMNKPSHPDSTVSAFKNKSSKESFSFNWGRRFLIIRDQISSVLPPTAPATTNKNELFSPILVSS